MTASYKISREMNTVENLTQHLLFGHFVVVVDVVVVVFFLFSPRVLFLFVCLVGWLVGWFVVAVVVLILKLVTEKPGLHNCKVKCQRLTPTEM